MSVKKWSVLLGVLVVASLILTACPAPQQQVVEKVVTQIVEQKVEVEKTVVVEKEKVVEKQVEVTPTPAPAEPKLRINLGTYPDIIDPQKSSFVNEIAHLKLIYEGLTKFNEKLETVPGSAEKWEYNADATELTFTLRPDLKYSDGTPLNAARFAYALTRNIDPETAGEYASITDEIKGAPEWRAADITAADYDAAKFKEALGVKASHADGSDCNADAPYDDAECLTLKLTFSKPAPYFHTIMGIWVAYPAKEELISEGGENWWNSSKYQIGNGPFVLTSLEPFVVGNFKPNTNYWGDKPTYDIEYRYITDTAVSFEAYKNNEFDMVASAAEDLQTIDADPDLKAQHMVYPGSCTTVIKLGLAGVYKDPSGADFQSPFLDPKVREAFAYGFNAEGWAKDVDQGLSLPTWTWIPPGYPGYNPESPMKFDPELAKKSLAESTYGGPEKLNALGLKLTYGDTPRNRVRSEWLAANYKDILGVDIALDPVDSTTFTALTKDPKTFPLLARQGWCADYPDPQNWLSVYWRSDTTFAQRQGYVNPDFDKLTQQADVELDAAKRMDLYKQAQDLLLADFPSAFGYNSVNHYLVKPWVTGVSQTPQDSDWAGSMVPASIKIDAAAQQAAQ
jgi:oligopeptide transport system substrate-binding protein